MGNLRILTAGESHGKGLVGILEGLPAGLKLNREKIDEQLKRRQGGYGRGERMQIEFDHAEILSGVRFGVTLGSPIAVLIENRDWANWKDRMGVWEGKEDSPVKVPRPGHADLAGSFKYGHRDLRNVLERASARETAMRVALGSIVRQLLEGFDIWIGSHVVQIHQVASEETFRKLCEKWSPKTVGTIREMCSRAEESEVRCGNRMVDEIMRKTILMAKENGDSVGGVFEVAALNVPVGLGSCTQGGRRLDGLISAELMSIPGIKAVEIGLGIESGSRFGSEVHDPIVPGETDVPARSSNRAGGIEGGMSNGMPIVVRATMKPIPTLKKPLPSIDLETGRAVLAHKERSDVCAVPAASVVGETMMAITLGNAFCEKFGGDSLQQMKDHYNASGKIFSG